MDSFFENIAAHLGDQVSGDHVKLIFCILATYPLALIYRTLPTDSPNSRHLFSIAYAVIAMVFVLKLYMGMLHITITALFTYTFMRLYHGKNGPYINFVVAMISMSICHIDRQLKGFEGSSKLDYSGALMILTIKFTSFGFNVADGRSGAVTDYNKRMKIDPFPSPIEYLGWLCYFAGFLVGPTCEYMDYYRFTNYFFVSPSKHLSPYRPAFQKFVFFLVTAWLVAFVGQHYNYFRMMEDDFAASPFYKKIFALEIVGRLQHCKYGCMWLLAEGACVLSGFGYNGIRNGKHQWDRLSNIYWVGLEGAQSFKDISNSWNLGCNTWLRHYVYMRLCPPGAKPDSYVLVGTYTVSAFWHGFHPGYYALISGFGIYQALSRSVRRTIRPLVMSTDGKTPLPVWKNLYDIASYIATNYSSAILMAPFELLYVSRTRKVWSSIYYIHIWGYLTVWAVVTFLGPTLKQIQKGRVERAITNDKKNVAAKKIECAVQELELKQQKLI
ncbi:MBOAT, membrane-bound O-acyltransferase family-domain-containing protein [Phascolomyces articulosus]|uniref:MBOAT, membrane-bound O-acyltransferase family-domain-containing protein n=1 Tax=Phascolomyces articulosus TaxID=60185 RepID=A0AAD5K2H5_9FUNG|nr:MBOAT, membrane-bound O-acyltransferase family-domain-containing protein [Phascolomyces articulosus]